MTHPVRCGGCGVETSEPAVPRPQSAWTASELRAELEAALPRLAPERQLGARQLIGQLEETISTLSVALTIEDTATGIGSGLQAPPAG